METVTLSGEDFKTIHNTLCELRGIVGRMSHSMIKTDELERVIEAFESGLRSAYDQDNSSFDAKMDYYSRFQRDNGLSSIWSIYELPMYGFLGDHPYPSDAFVCYQEYHVPVSGPTWGDVYRAADRCIQLSGDDHHCFIEGFRLNGNGLEMFTGS